MLIRVQPYESVIRNFEALERLVINRLISARPSTTATDTAPQRHTHDAAIAAGNLILERIADVREAAVEFARIERFTVQELQAELNRRHAASGTAPPTQALPPPNVDDPDPTRTEHPIDELAQIQHCASLVREFEYGTPTHNSRLRAARRAYAHIADDIQKMAPETIAALLAEAQKRSRIPELAGEPDNAVASLRIRQVCYVLAKQRRALCHGSTHADRAYRDACDTAARTLIGLPLRQSS